jgi:hypothetical protein
MVKFECDVCHKTSVARVPLLRIPDEAHTVIQSEPPTGWIAVLTDRRVIVACSKQHLVQALVRVPAEEKPIIERAAGIVP